MKCFNTVDKTYECVECHVYVCEQCLVQCELCMEHFCWDDIGLGDQGNDPR